MNLQWNTSVIDPQELIQIARGDRRIVYKYLQQFRELIPERIESLTERLRAKDRKLVRQILHQMSPQLQFFGIKDIVQPIRRLEHEYETMPYTDLCSLVEDILGQLKLALDDVDVIIKENF